MIADYKIWKNHPSKKWNYSPFYSRKHGFDRRVGLLTGRVVPYTCNTKKNCRTNRNQWVINTENGEKETLNSSSAWKHHKWVKGLKIEEEPALAPLEKDLKVTSVWSKNWFSKMKNISLLQFLSICRTIEYMVKERNRYPWRKFT